MQPCFPSPRVRPFAGLLFLLLPSLFLPAAEPRPAPPDRPHILWITSEDNSPLFLRLYDPAGAPMPNLERLAAGGLVFRHAFSNAPVCSTARSTLMSGCYAPRLGAHYHRRSAFPPLPTGHQLLPAFLRAAGYYTSNNVKTDYNFQDPGVWDESSSRATWRGRAPGQPFFHVQNHTTTHESSLHFTAESLAAQPPQTDPASVPLLPFLPDTPLVRATVARYLDQHRLLDAQIGSLLDQLQADGLAEDTIVFYFGDNGGVIPGTKGHLTALSTHIPLVVYFPPRWRHLAPAPPGSRLDGFVEFVDFLPTVLRLAGLPPPAVGDGQPFLGPGLALPELAARSETLGYADRFDEKYDFVRSLRSGRFYYVRHFFPFQPEGLHNLYRYKMLAYQEWRDRFHAGLLSPAQAAFFLPRPAEALYDLENDPFQQVNLASDPAHAATLAALRDRLSARLKALPDLGFLPEPVFLADALSDPAGYGRSHRAELADLVDLADLALQPYAAASSALARNLAHESLLHRYWACLVAASFGPQAAPLAPFLRPLAQSDPSPLVRARAAEALALAAGDDPRPALPSALRLVSSPVEAALLLQSVVLLRDHYGWAPFPVDVSFLPSDWSRLPLLAPRLQYLAEPAPFPLAQHLFFDPLTSPPPPGSPRSHLNQGGQYTSTGWSMTQPRGFLRIDLGPAGPPLSGELSVTLSGLDWQAVAQAVGPDRKIHFLNLFSNPSGDHHVEQGGTPSDALITLRGGTSPDGTPRYGSDLKLLWASRGAKRTPGSDYHEQRLPLPENFRWDPARPATFTLRWSRDPGFLSILLDGHLLLTVPWSGQGDPLRYVFLGGAADFHALPGVTFSHLTLRSRERP